MQPTSPQTPPHSPLALPPSSGDHGSPHHKSLVISVVVAAIFLLGAIGVVAWLFMKNDSGRIIGGTHSVSQGTNDQSTKDVKKVSFVPPANIPPQYVKRDQSTSDVTTVYYFDNATSCGITLSTLKLGGQFGNTPKETIINSAKTAESLGVKTAKSSDGATVKLKDVANNNTYNFSSLDLEQDIDVPGVTFKKQFNVIAFHQFGQQVASIGYSCKADAWADKKAELLALAMTFKVKTEK